MALNSKTERLTYILRGRMRCEIYRILLTGNRTIGELSRNTGKSISNVSRVIKQLESYNLVKNLTPSVSIGCLYQLTDDALECKPEFEEHMEFQNRL